MDNDLGIREETTPLETRYEFLEKLSSSGVIQFYKVINLSQFGRKVRCLKEIPVAINSDENNSKLVSTLQEIDILLTIQNGTSEFQNLIQVHDCFSMDNRLVFYIEMDFIDGGNGNQYQQRVKTWLDNGKRLHALESLLTNFYYLCKSLLYLHSNCIIHRAIQPENLLYDTELDLLMFTDFSMACSTADCFGLVRSNIVDPISFFQTKTLDEASDIYNLGVCFYQFLLQSSYLPHFIDAQKYDQHYDTAVKILQLLQDSLTENSHEGEGTKMSESREKYKVSEGEENQLVIQSAIIMIESVKQMLAPFQVSTRPTLQSILQALDTENIQALKPLKIYTCPNLKKLLPRNIVNAHNLYIQLQQLLHEAVENRAINEFIVDKSSLIYQLRQLAGKKRTLLSLLRNQQHYAWSQFQHLMLLKRMTK